MQDSNQNPLQLPVDSLLITANTFAPTHPPSTEEATKKQQFLDALYSNCEIKTAYYAAEMQRGTSDEHTEDEQKYIKFFAEQFTALIEKFKLLCQSQVGAEAQFNLFRDKIVTWKNIHFADRDQTYYSGIKENLETILFKLSQDSSITNSHKESILKNLLSNLNVCAPGIFGHIEIEARRLVQQDRVAFWLAELRNNCVQGWVSHVFKNDLHSENYANAAFILADQLGFQTKKMPVKEFQFAIEEIARREEEFKRAFFEAYTPYAIFEWMAQNLTAQVQTCTASLQVDGWSDVSTGEQRQALETKLEALDFEQNKIDLDIFNKKRDEENGRLLLQLKPIKSLMLALVKYYVDFAAFKATERIVNIITRCIKENYHASLSPKEETIETQVCISEAQLTSLGKELSQGIEPEYIKLFFHEMNGKYFLYEDEILIQRFFKYFTTNFNDLKIDNFYYFYKKFFIEMQKKYNLVETEFIIISDVGFITIKGYPELSSFIDPDTNEQKPIYDFFYGREKLVHSVFMRSYLSNRFGSKKIMLQSFLVREEVSVQQCNPMPDVEEKEIHGVRFYVTANQPDQSCYVPAGSNEPKMLRDLLNNEVALVENSEVLEYVLSVISLEEIKSIIFRIVKKKKDNTTNYEIPIHLYEELMDKGQVEQLTIFLKYTLSFHPVSVKEEFLYEAVLKKHVNLIILLLNSDINLHDQVLSILCEMTELSKIVSNSTLNIKAKNKLLVRLLEAKYIEIIFNSGLENFSLFISSIYTYYNNAEKEIIDQLIGTLPKLAMESNKLCGFSTASIVDKNKFIICYLRTLTPLLNQINFERVVKCYLLILIKNLEAEQDFPGILLIIKYFQDKKINKKYADLIELSYEKFYYPLAIYYLTLPDSVKNQKTIIWLIDKMPNFAEVSDKLFSFAISQKKWVVMARILERGYSKGIIYTITEDMTEAVWHLYNLGKFKIIKRVAKLVRLDLTIKFSNKFDQELNLVQHALKKYQWSLIESYLINQWVLINSSPERSADFNGVLWSAYSAKKFKLIKILIEKGCISKEEINNHNPTFLEIAIKLDQWDIIIALHRAGLIDNEIDISRLVQIALENSNWDLLISIVKDTNFPDVFVPALQKLVITYDQLSHISVENNSNEITKESLGNVVIAMLNAGVDFDVKTLNLSQERLDKYYDEFLKKITSFSSLIYIAGSNHHWSLLKRIITIIKDRKQINCYEHQLRIFALIPAIKAKNEEMVRKLIEAGSAIISFCSNENLLFIVIENGNDLILQLILERMESEQLKDIVNSLFGKNKDNKTPFELAIEHNQLTMAYFILSQCEKINNRMFKREQFSLENDKDIFIHKAIESNSFNLLSNAFKIAQSMSVEKIILLKLAIATVNCQDNTATKKAELLNLILRYYKCNVGGYFYKQDADALIKCLNEMLNNSIQLINENSEIISVLVEYGANPHYRAETKALSVYEEILNKKQWHALLALFKYEFENFPVDCKYKTPGLNTQNLIALVQAWQDGNPFTEGELLANDNIFRIYAAFDQDEKDFLEKILEGPIKFVRTHIIENEEKIKKIIKIILNQDLIIKNFFSFAIDDELQSDPQNVNIERLSQIKEQMNFLFMIKRSCSTNLQLEKLRLEAFIALLIQLNKILHAPVVIKKVVLNVSQCGFFGEYSQENHISKVGIVSQLTTLAVLAEQEKLTELKLFDYTAAAINKLDKLNILNI